MAKEANNKFEVMAQSSGNLLTDAQYLADAERIAGSVQGLARSILNNTAIRMNSIMAVALANFIARKQSGETIDTTLTPEQIDAFFEEALQAATDNAPSALVLPATYNSADNRFEIADAVFPSGYVLPTKGKLTVEFPEITDATELAELAVLRVLGTNYPLLVKDVPGNQPANSEVDGEVISVYRESTNIIINRNKPIEAIESEYNLSIQSQQTIVPVENSPFGDEKVVGESAIQEVVNGDFADGITDWAESNVSGFAESGGVASFIATALNGNISKPGFNVVSGTDYLIRVLIKTTSSLVSVSLSGGGLATHSGSGEWEIVSSIWTSSFDGAANIRIQDGRSSAWDLVECDDAMIIPLLSAKQLAMSLSDLNKKYPVYFESLKSVENPEIKVTGNNLLDRDNGIRLNTTIGVTGNVSASTQGDFVFDVPNAIVGEDYIVSGDDVGDNPIFAMYSSKTIQDDTTLIRRQAGSQVVNIDDGTKHMLVKFNGLFVGNIPTADIQLEQGASSTIYDNFKNSSKKYNNQILRDVPNGVADYIDTVNNTLHELTKEYILTEDDIISWVNAVGVDQVTNVKIAKPLDFIDYNTTTPTNGISFRRNGYWGTINSSLWEQTEGINSISVQHNITQFLLVLAKDTYASLAEAKTALAGTKLIYQLAEEVITENINPDGIAFAYKNMTIEIIQDNGFSNSWIAKHALNDAETIRSLGKALQEAEKQITRNEEEIASIEAKLALITVTEAIDLDKVAEYTNLRNTDFVVPTTDEGSTPNITLASSADHKKLVLDLLIDGIYTAEAVINNRTTGLSVVGAVTVHVTNLIRYSFEFRRIVSSTGTYVFDLARKYTTTPGSPANIVEDATPTGEIVITNIDGREI